MNKRLDPGTITIEKIIVHDIPKHAKGDLSVEPRYSEHESKLSESLKLFFKDKVVQALISDKAFKISYNLDSESPVGRLTGEILESDGGNFVGHSKMMTKYLFEVQMGLNAAGILMCIYGTINKNLRTLIILKLERDTGAQLRIDPNTNSYNIDEVKDLMLTQKTKIYKVALFIQRQRANSDFDGMIMDYQIDVKAKKEVITWFIDRFLGCKAFEDPKITTQNFYNYTRAFIDTLEDTLDKAKYIQDLNSYVQKNSVSLNPKEFADDYLISIEHRNNYKDYLTSRKFQFSEFPKDISQIDRQLKRFVVEFENGISIIGQNGSFDNKVKLEKMTDGSHRAEIRSRIKTMK